MSDDTVLACGFLQHTQSVSFSWFYSYPEQDVYVKQDVYMDKLVMETIIGSVIRKGVEQKSPTYTLHKMRHLSSDVRVFKKVHQNDAIA